MTSMCIAQDPEGQWSIWANTAQTDGRVTYEVQDGRDVYCDIPDLETALGLVGLPATNASDALAGFIAAVDALPADVRAALMEDDDAWIDQAAEGEGES